MPSFGEDQVSELQRLLRHIESATIIDGQLLLTKGPAAVQNCLYLLEHDKEIWALADTARNLVLAFAQTLERQRLLMPERGVPTEPLRTRSIEAIGRLQQALKSARPNDVARALDLG